MRQQAAGVERAAEGDAPTIDLAVLERATFGDPALAREVLSLFSERAEKLLAQIAGAADVRTRREAAHGLKGAALGVGAIAVAEAAADVETAAGDPHAFPGSLAHLSALVAVARLAIAGLLLRN
jgi:HPt (histidine-containing phosphotransfer) domain-containing protein